jgi:hypothetical protein
MGLFTRDIKTMEDLFLHTLKDMFGIASSKRRLVRRSKRKLVQRVATVRNRKAFRA